MKPIVAIKLRMSFPPVARIDPNTAAAHRAGQRPRFMAPGPSKEAALAATGREVLRLIRRAALRP